MTIISQKHWAASLLVLVTANVMCIDVSMAEAADDGAASGAKVRAEDDSDAIVVTARRREDAYSRSLGWTRTAMTPMMFVCPLLPAAIFDRTGHFDLSWPIYIALTAGAFAISFLASPRPQPMGPAAKANASPRALSEKIVERDTSC